MGDEKFDAVSTAPGLKETLAFVTGRSFSENQRLQVTRVKNLLLLAHYHDACGLNAPNPDVSHSARCRSRGHRERRPPQRTA